MKKNLPSLDLSILVPVYNEVSNVAQLHAQILDVLNKTNKKFEIIFIDDGSDDGTLEQLKALFPVTIVCLQKHYGKAYALDAGIKQAQGDILITLDGDGQNDPLDIPEFLTKINEGFEVVCGWRYKRNDPLEKLFVSRGAAILRKILIKDDVHDAVCGIHAYRRECFDKVELYGGLHRMIPAILRWRGFKMTEIKVRHHPRLRGKSKYGWQRIIEGFRDMVYIWFWRRDPSRPLYAGKKIKYVISNVIKI